MGTMKLGCLFRRSAAVHRHACGLNGILGNEGKGNNSSFELLTIQVSKDI